MNRRLLYRWTPVSLTLLMATGGCYFGIDPQQEVSPTHGANSDGGTEGSADGGDGGTDSPPSDGTSVGGADDEGTGGEGDDDGGGTDTPAPFDPSKPESYVRKVKLLLTGMPVLETELALVNADPAALRDLVRDWTETENFRKKMQAFFQVAFQQGTVTRFNIVSQLRGSDAAANFFLRDIEYANLTESFARTAWNIVEQGRPFTEVANTRRWMMTTSMMVFLSAVDHRKSAGPHQFYHNSPPAGMSATSSLATQVANRAWYIPNNCVDPTVQNGNQAIVIGALQGFLKGPGCPNGYDAPLKDSDFSDWREVEIYTLGPDEEIVEYYDIPNLRNAAVLGLNTPRAGYFSTPAFLANWRSNIDNSFRVTTNQMLIVGLGQSLDDEDATIPLDESGLSDDHADPTTTCYGCHSKLDPMRNFFMKEFDPDFYTPSDENADVIPSFGFYGHVREGDDLVDLGDAIATHPMFAEAWAQKLCYLANSQECDFKDPEFERVVDHFVGSGHDFRELVIELFSSPLITGAERTQTHETNEFLVSMIRRAHLCQMLKTRLGVDGLCNGNKNVSQSIPDDAWSRGSSTPFQPANVSLFYSASLESFCESMSTKVVDKDGSPLQSSNMDSSVTFLVETLMDLSAEDSRNPMAYEALLSHLEGAAMITNNNKLKLQSAFTLACTSPFVTAVGY